MKIERVRFPTSQKDIVGESVVTPLIERFFVIPTDVPGVALLSLLELLCSEIHHKRESDAAKQPLRDRK